MPWVRVVYRRGRHYGVAELFEPSAAIAGQIEQVLAEPNYANLSVGEAALSRSVRDSVAEELAKQRSVDLQLPSEHIVSTPGGALEDPWGYRLDDLPGSP